MGKFEGLFYSVSSKSFRTLIILLSSLWASFLCYLAFDFISGGELYQRFWLVNFSAFVILIGFAFLHQNSANIQRDESVFRFVDQKHYLSDTPFILFIRPFSSDGELSHLDGEASMDFFYNIDGLGSFESKLVTALEADYMLVRLDCGSKDFSLTTRAKLYFNYGRRMGSFTCDPEQTDWKTLFQLLARHSHMCVIAAPATASSSTSEEIAYLQEQGLLEKSVIIMPESKFKLRLSKEKYVAKQAWENLRTCVGGNIHLPVFSRSGGLAVYISGRFQLINGLCGFQWGRTKAIKRLFAGGKISGPPWKNGLRLCYKLLATLLANTFILLLANNLLSTSGLQTSQAVTTISSSVIILFWWHRYYKQCSYFLLTRNQAISLAIFTPFIFALGYIVSGILIVALEIGGYVTPHVFNFGSAPPNTYTLAFYVTQFMVSIAFVYIFSVFWFFKKHTTTYLPN